MAQVTISLPDGSQRSFDDGATTTDVAASIGRGHSAMASPVR